MAEGGSVEERCGCLAGGVCRNGRGCPHARCHPTRRGNNVCQFYLSGRCIYGSRCWYNHGQRSGAGSLPSGGSEHSQDAAGYDGLRLGPGYGRSAAARAPFAGPLPARRPNYTGPARGGGAVMPRATSWADAPEFYPRGWSTPASAGSAQRTDDPPPSKRASLPPPPIDSSGAGSSCVQHELCDLCQTPSLHPHDEEQRRQHREQCARRKGEDRTPAGQRGEGKTCGICMDVVMEKEPASEQRFGLLERCNHSFCLTCIRRWRNCKEFDNEVVMACPMCRRPSSFVTPSSSWVDMGEEKDKLLAAYKVAMSQKPCRYFKEGRGYCPFAGSCLYRHEYPDGSSAAGSRPRLRSFQSSDSDTADSPYLWDILDVVDSPQFANFYLGLEAEAPRRRQHTIFTTLNGTSGLTRPGQIRAVICCPLHRSPSCLLSQLSCVLLSSWFPFFLAACKATAAPQVAALLPTSGRESRRLPLTSVFLRRGFFCLCCFFDEIRFVRRTFIATGARRKDRTLWELTKHSRICSNHFVNGEKCNDPRSPAYLPTLFPSEYRCTKTPSVDIYERFRSREQSREPTSSCVQEPAADEEGYDSTNGLIIVCLSLHIPTLKSSHNINITKLISQVSVLTGTTKQALESLVEIQTDPCAWTLEPDMQSLFLCCMQDSSADTQATFPSKKETKDAAWGTSYGVKASTCDPANIDSLKSTSGFRGYPSVSACSIEKASDILKSIAGVSLPVFSK